MKKLESSLKNMALALTGFSVVAGGLLGWVNDITTEPIAQANAKTLSDAIAVVVPEFDNNPAEAPEEVDLDGVIYKVYKATKGGEFVGAAVESSSMGFGGEIKVLVGFDTEGNIKDYSLLHMRKLRDWAQRLLIGLRKVPKEISPERIRVRLR